MTGIETGKRERHHARNRDRHDHAGLLDVGRWDRFGAHRPEESDPAADATVESPPTVITLTFSEDINPTFATVVVKSADGRDWISGPPRVEGPRLDVSMRSDYPVAASTPWDTAWFQRMATPCPVPTCSPSPRVLILLHRHPRPLAPRPPLLRRTGRQLRRVRYQDIDSHRRRRRPRTGLRNCVLAVEAAPKKQRAPQ